MYLPAGTSSTGGAITVDVVDRQCRNRSIEIRLYLFLHNVSGQLYNLTTFVIIYDILKTVANIHVYFIDSLHF